MRNGKSLGFLGTALLLAACGSEGAGGGGGGTTLTLKQCAAGQVLSTDSSGQFVCRDLPKGAVSLPVCDKDTGAVTSDGKALSCTDRNVADSNVASATTRLNTIRDKIADLSNRTTVVQGKGGGAAVFIGTTTNTYKGAIGDANGNIGVAAAANNCVAQFGAGAHMCSVYEIYNSVASGKLTVQTTVAESWVYMAAWRQVSGATDPSDGLNENCAGFTYPTGDKKWYGTTFQWGQVTFTGRFAPKFVGDVACSDLKPIACCK